MTANPDSALRQALEAAENATYRIVQHHEIARGGEMYTNDRDLSDNMAEIAREAHALITEALQRGET